MQNLLNLLKVKSLMTLLLIGVLCFLVIQNPNEAEYRTALLSAVSLVMGFYFAKKDSGEV